MASPESETGTEAVFSEAQMRALAGMLQGMVDKAVKDRGQGEATGGEGGASGSRDANRETPGELGVGRVGRDLSFQGWAAGPTGGVGKWRPAGTSVGPRAQRARGGVYRCSLKHGVDVGCRTAGNNLGGRVPGPQVRGHGSAWQVGRGGDAGGQRSNRPRASGPAPVGQAREPSTKEGCPQELAAGKGVAAGYPGQSLTCAPTLPPSQARYVWGRSHPQRL